MSPSFRKLTLILALVSIQLSAEPGEFEEKTIVSIEFDPPVQPYPRERLHEMLPLKQGQPLRISDVRAAIDRLVATGRYSDIEVDAQNQNGGVTLRFLTTLNFFIGRVTVEGVPEPPNRGVLVNATRLDLGTLYSDDQTERAIGNLREVLRGNGFFQHRIEPRFEHDPVTQQVQIRFVVTPGERARYTIPLITGHPERPEEEVWKTTRWKRIWFLGWRPVTEARTQSGIARIRQSYQKQDRLTAQVSLLKMDYEPDTNRVRPALNVEAGPKVRITTVGAKLSRGKLRQLIPVFEEQSVDRDLLVEGVRNLTEYFESQGYFHTKVDFTSNLKVANGAPGNGGMERKTEEIVYSIDRGERHTIVAVNISGNRYFDTQTIKERMYIRPASLIQFRRGRYSSTFLRRDIGAIEALYISNGFRDVEVTPKVEHRGGGDNAEMVVNIEIVEGQQWLVHKLTVNGASPENLEIVKGFLQSTEGQPFSETNVAIDRENILEYYFNRGYPEAVFLYTSTPATANTVDLTYTIQEGAHRFVRDVLISGLTTTDPDLVRERIQLGPGDPLSRARMLETQRRLYELGIFAKVDMAQQNPKGDEADKYILLQAEESRRYTITGGIGAEIAKIGGSSEVPEAPAGKAGFSPRVYFDVTRRNAFGQGHIASFRSRVSTLQRRAVVSYQAPQFRGNPDLNLTFSATYDDSRNVRTFRSRRHEGAVQIGERLSRANTMLYRFAYRRVAVTDVVVPNLDLLFPQFANSVRLGILGATFIQDRRDDPTNATRGVYNTFDIGWASRIFGSEADFTNSLGRNSTYHSFGVGKRYVFARSLTFGWQQTLGSRDEVPLPERFFSGGATTHRGFPQNQAGPRDPETGFPLGGKALLLNQFELRFPLLGENIGGVFFHDAGNVYGGLNRISLRVRQHDLSDFNYMVHAVGFGIRYRTPVGPVRLDLAYVPNSPQFFGLKGTRQELIEGRGVPERQRISRFQFHFSLGQAF